MHMYTHLHTYCRTHTHTHTHTHRGIDIDGGTIGIAFVGAMCSTSSVGLTQDGGRSLTSVIITAAHELGHIFNMQHDDGKMVC